MKRMLSILLALCLAAGLLCAAAAPVYAQEDAFDGAPVVLQEEEAAEEEGTPWYEYLLWALLIAVGAPLALGVLGAVIFGPAVADFILNAVLTILVVVIGSLIFTVVPIVLIGVPAGLAVLLIWLFS